MLAAGQLQTNIDKIKVKCLKIRTSAVLVTFFPKEIKFSKTFAFLIPFLFVNYGLKPRSHG